MSQVSHVISVSSVKFQVTRFQKIWHQLQMKFFYLQLYRDPKSPNFPVGRISRAKTFRTERVNRFHDKNAPKVRKLFFRHKCTKNAYIAFTKYILECQNCLIKAIYFTGSNIYWLKNADKLISIIFHLGVTDSSSGRNGRRSPCRASRAKEL